MMGTADLADANVVMLFQRAAARRGAAPAILSPAGRVLWTFDGLADAAGRLAGALVSAGVRPGDRVLLLEPDRRRRYALVGAIMWAGGAVVVPPASVAPWRAIAAAAAAAEPHAVLLAPWLLPMALAHRALRAIPIRLLTAGPRLPGPLRLADLPSGPIPHAHVTAGDAAVLSFTTGSTRAPKLVRRTHGVLRAQHDALERLRGLTTDDRELVGLPLLVLHNLGSGVASVLAPSGRRFRRDGQAVIESLARTRATAAAGLPALFEAAAGRAAAGRLSGLRSIQVGGTRVRAQVVAALARMAPAAHLEIVYGSTEVEPIAAIGGQEYFTTLADGDPALGVPAGRVVEGLELRLTPAPDGAIERHGRSVGVVSLRGAHAAAPDGPGGWVDTGDLGWTDRHGALWLLGRTADSVGSLMPFEVELATERLDHVRRAALVRAPSRLGPRAIVAAELAAGGGDAAAAVTAAVGDLAGERGWQIDGVVVRRRLPETRGPARKVDTVTLARGLSS